MAYTTQALSREELRQYASAIRSELQLENTLYFPVVEFLEGLPCLFPDLNYEIVEDNDLESDVHAHYDVVTNTIRIKNFVYIGACSGNGRDRMTIIHEISHYLLIGHSHLVLNRAYSNHKIPAYCDPEWQAKCLAGELMVPEHLVGTMSLLEVVRACGVSTSAAEYQLKKQRSNR